MSSRPDVFFAEVAAGRISDAVPNVSREMLFLAEQASEGGFPVLPGKQWAFHYPLPPQQRAERVAAFRNGECALSDLEQDLRPDALLYSTDDIASLGLRTVTARIRDLTADAQYFDYARFVSFIQSATAHDVSFEAIESLYRGIAKARTQKKLIDAYGKGGREQILDALRREVLAAPQALAQMSRPERILTALKSFWFLERMGGSTVEDHNRILSSLSGDERDLFQILKKSYIAYTHEGSEDDYGELVAQICAQLAILEGDTHTRDESSDRMQQLERELEPLKEKVGFPGNINDPGIPPEDSDEYHTPMPHGGESSEHEDKQVFFTITPPLEGNYCSGRKSYFDKKEKTWSKKKYLTPYETALTGAQRYTISGSCDGGCISLPIPNAYALDCASIQSSGSPVSLWRDQNGCFYITSQGWCSFSVDFLKEPRLFIGPVIPEDSEPLSVLPLSSETEQCIDMLSGGVIQKAEAVRQYICAHHFYPAGGDLRTAQALQYKLRNGSAAETYIADLDASEYLECYSANTLFIAIMRRAGIPSRLVVGHRVEGEENGAAAITETTGHAWAEIWDGLAWRRFDATPRAKPEDKRPEQMKDNEDSGERAGQKAEDGGVENFSSPEQEKGREDNAVQQQSPHGPGEPSVSNDELTSAQQQLDAAKQHIKQQTEQKEKLSQKVQNAQNFEDLEKAREDIEKSDLFDEWKGELERLADALKDQKQQEMNDMLDRMTEDGFLADDAHEALKNKIVEATGKELDLIKEQIGEESSQYAEYNAIREEVMPYVDHWFQFFASRLPRDPDISTDEDSLSRQGAFNRHSVMRARNLLFGTVKNPRVFDSSIRPRFIAALVVDVSGSMMGDKLRDARKLLVFYAELFSRISEEFGYIRFSIDVFSDTLSRIKSCEQKYDSSQRYDYEAGGSTTVKARLMKSLTAKGGTNMLDALRAVAHELNNEIANFPDYASALYFLGDGGDTQGNAGNIKTFLELNDAEGGFGEHMRTAILLGEESQRHDLAEIFGEEHTQVAPNFDDLLEQSMEQFDMDIEDYLKFKAA